MEYTVYLVLAIAGGGILLVQVVLQLLGLAGAGDFDGTHGHVGDAGSGDPGADASWFFGVLSFKALVAFAGFFGLSGLALYEPLTAAGTRLAIAGAAGTGGMLLVAFLLRSLRRLGSSGTLDVRNAVGSVGSVYLRIPAYGRGAGKVTLEVQGRSVELPAITDGDEIATGQRVKVVALSGDDTLKVMPA
ncbi:MAG: hypothetical protein ACKOSS_00435 [Planctomycetia bacterium]